MVLEKLRKNIEEHTPYVMHSDKKYVQLDKVIDGIRGIEETHVVKPKVELTQTQSDFIASFRGNKRKALYFISWCGWGYYIKDGNGVIYTDETVEDEERLNKLMGMGSNANVKTLDELVELLIDAIVNGYTVKEEVPLYVCYLQNPNGENSYLIVRKTNGKLYLDINSKDLCDTFTEEEAREQLDWILPHMERVN